MPGNLRYGLTSGLSTASKKRRPGSHYLESPFFIPNTDQNCTPVSFHLPLGILGSLTFAEELGLSKSNWAPVSRSFLRTAFRLCRSFSDRRSLSHWLRCASVLAVTVDCDEKNRWSIKNSPPAVRELTSRKSRDVRDPCSRVLTNPK